MTSFCRAIAHWRSADEASHDPMAAIFVLGEQATSGERLYQQGRFVVG